MNLYKVIVAHIILCYKKIDATAELKKKKCKFAYQMQAYVWDQSVAALGF